MFQKGWYKLEPADATKASAKTPAIPRLHKPIAIRRATTAIRKAQAPWSGALALDTRLSSKNDS